MHDDIWCEWNWSGACYLEDVGDGEGTIGEEADHRHGAVLPTCTDPLARDCSTEHLQVWQDKLA